MAADIEHRWQERWAAEHTFEAPNPAGPLADPDRVGGRPKLFILDMFPYPSGAGLHVGHPLGYIGTDVFGRYRRMKGFNVLHALGYDAFGLPAEQYAIETGTHPQVRTEENIANYRRQLRRLGLAHDPRRSISTTDESYYRWTQWIFLQIFESWYDRDQGGPARSRSCATSWPPGPGRRLTAGRGRRCRRWSSARWSTTTGWPTCPRRRSTGARAWAPCWPTRRSRPRAAATGATSPCSAATCASG